KLANATQDYLSAVQLARSEAIRRNVPVEFVLTDTAVNTTNFENALTSSAAGANWAVRAASDVASQPFTLIETKAGRDGAGDATATNAVQVAASGPTGFAGVVSFNGFGGTSDGAPYALDISNSAAGICKALGGPIRCRRITVTAGGRIAACDPDTSLPTTDTRRCP
ncbi:MAG: GspH/FimT family pseudopilin, partial [Caldimonas sp.]